MHSRWKWILALLMISPILSGVLVASLAVKADADVVGGTIPPVAPIDKSVETLHEDGQAYSNETVTYTIALNNLSVMSYTARIGVTDSVPLSLTVIGDTIHASAGTTGLAQGNLITWEVDVEFGGEYSLTYEVTTPPVTATTAFTNTAVIYEISNKWVPTTTQATTTTHAVLIVEPPPHTYLPLIRAPKRPLPALANYNFESGTGVGWVEQINGAPGKLIYEPVNGYPTVLDGTHFAWLGGFGRTVTLSQTLTIPAGYDSLGITYLFQVDSGEDVTGNDTAQVQIAAAGVAPLVRVYDLSRSASHGWERTVLDLKAFEGKQIQLEFSATLNDTRNSNFFVDKVEVCSTDADRIPVGARSCSDLSIP